MRVIPSDKPDKKYVAIFKDGTKTHFGSALADDYTKTGDKEQRERYRTRHAKDLKTNDPTRAGYLAMNILWGNSTSIRENVRQYKKKYGDL